MKALAFLGIGKVGVIEKPIPDPGPNEAVIKTTASLICTSDVHIVRGVIPLPDWFLFAQVERAFHLDGDKGR